MTDARAGLRERVARAMYERWQSTRPSAPPFDRLLASSRESELADADVAIDLVLEEAAKVAENASFQFTQTHPSTVEVVDVRHTIAAAIRALPEKEKRTAAMDKLLETDGTLLRDE